MCAFYSVICFCVSIALNCVLHLNNFFFIKLEIFVFKFGSVGLCKNQYTFQQRLVVLFLLNEAAGELLFCASNKKIFRTSVYEWKFLVSIIFSNIHFRDKIFFLFIIYTRIVFEIYTHDKRLISNRCGRDLLLYQEYCLLEKKASAKFFKMHATVAM